MKIGLSLAVTLLCSLACAHAKSTPAAPADANVAPALPPESTAAVQCVPAAEAKRWRESFARGGSSPEDRARIERVTAQLVQIAPLKALAWPPQFEIEESEDPNAYAACFEVDGQPLPQSLVVVTTALLTKVVEGKDARLAAILGHEMGHLALHHHSVNAQKTATRYRAGFYQRGAESAADVYGMALALKAGYKYADLLGGMHRLYDLFPEPPVSCTECDHPTPSERMANLDHEKARLWRAVSAFDSGVFFTAAGDYEEAARLFRQVIAQFPESWEAQANLGHALLMQYADALGPEDVKRLRVGHLAMGAFYRRPDSVAKYLEVRPHLREQAIEALNGALKLNPNDPIAIGNLGIAHLLDPAGTDADQASWLLEEALKKSEGRPLQEVAGISINLAVAYDAAGKKEKAREALGQTVELFGDVRGVDMPALQYNIGMAFAASRNADERANGLQLLEAYLHEIAGASAWWDQAYAQYSSLAKEMGKAPAPREALLKTSLREVLSVRWADGKHVALADEMARVQSELGARQPVQVVQGQGDLVRLSYPERGSEVVGSDVVLAVVLKGDNAPVIEVRGHGLGSPVVGTVRPGMQVADFRKLLGEESDHSRIFGTDRAYAIYPGVNLAAAFERDKVSEIILVRSGRGD